MKLSIFGKEIISLTDSKIEKGRALRGYSKYRAHEGKITPKQLREIVRREPLISKAISKKSKDVFRNWFVVKNAETGEPLDGQALDAIRAFDEKVNFKQLLTKTYKCANIYGTGFIEKIYNEPKSTPPSKKVRKNAKLIDLKILDPERITQYKQKNENGDFFYIYQPPMGEEINIHPSRLVVIPVDDLPFSPFGTSKVLLLYNILQSKMNFDISSGEYLNWGGMGLYDLTIQNMTDEQEEAAHKELSKHPDFLVHDEDYELKVENPKSLDPKDFIDYYYVNIAAAVEMSKQMLVGGDFSDIGGSDIGVAAYYSDVENVQNEFSPYIIDIYKQMLRFFNISIPIEIDWNETYVDELSEAKILQTRAYSAVQCINSMNPIIDQSEARAILRDGYVDLDLTKKIQPIKNPKPISDPNIEPQPVKKPEKPPKAHAKFVPMSKTQLELIEKTRRLGEMELIEQEKRIAEGLKKGKSKTKQVKLDGIGV